MADAGHGERPAGSLLEGLVAAMPNAVVGTDAAFRVTVWNAGAERLYGYTSGEALGRFARELVTLVGDISHVELEAALARDGRMHGQLRAQRGDGAIADIEVSIRRVQDPPGYIGVHRGVTERRRIARALDDETLQELSLAMAAAVRHEPADDLREALRRVSRQIRAAVFDLRLDDLEEFERPQPARARVLLVDNHAATREAMAIAFADDGRFVVAAQAGTVAEARLALEGIDVAIIDLALPDGDGSDLIPELRAVNANAQALVLSGKLDRSAAARAVEKGAVGVLSKIAHLHEVIGAVRRVQAGETLIPLDEVVELLRLAGREREREQDERRVIETLTAREHEILQLLADGMDGRAMAARLHISPRTQRNHVANILSKLSVHSQLQAVMFGLRHGMVVLR